MSKKICRFYVGSKKLCDHCDYVIMLYIISVLKNILSFPILKTCVTVKI